ncbi:hypothetical protein KIN20_031654 [Parelaphostrongylus tenuis]|uniref:Uncharacterized protein n=1 Tax=Parelaphostrongylus tenuis TaxID=148309 RepID=A0AAD5R5L8_PARTN|nr:hypothetical protein KIN20_031654 [Parelaphostrongylus tenuis]
MDDSEMSITELSVSPESVAITVRGGGFDGVGGTGGVQICPALTLSSPQALGLAAKHIYSRLADHAVEIDEGMPNMILSLVSSGNQLSENYLSKFQSALSVLVVGGGLWLVSSGEYSDPLARTVSSTLRAILPQAQRSVEVLHMVINSTAVSIREESRLMVDAALNTMFILSRNIHTSSEEATFRANAVVRLAHPPPALLIGVPSEASTSGMTSSSGAAPPILLSPPSNDKQPFPVVVFAGASLVSLEELLIYVQSGVAVIILQDSCELCAVLYNAYLLYRSSLFDHSKFIIWLDEQLDTAAIHDVNAANKLIVKIFAIAFGDTQLIEFLDSDELPSLPSQIIELCLQCHNTATDARHLFQFAAHINDPSILDRIDLDDWLDNEEDTMIGTCEAFAQTPQSFSEIPFLLMS